MWTDPDWRARRLELAYSDGHTVEAAFGDFTLHPHTAGDLLVTTGHIVACDPGWLDKDTPAFKIRVALGRYPVILTIAHHQASGDERVAYATLRISDGIPVHSDIARFIGDEKILRTAKGKDYVPNYSVDAGTGCFMDRETLGIILQQEDDIFESVFAEMEKTFVNTWEWANYLVDEETGANMVAFTSGWGDGGYPTYIGYDSDDKVVCFVTDFGVVPMEDSGA